MMITRANVLDVKTVADNVLVLTFDSPAIATSILPGQFVNIRVHDGVDPLLRRPFSVSRIDGHSVEILFGVVGKGTEILARKRSGDMLDVLGPLGVPYNIKGAFEHAILIAGGLGVAPMPFVTSELERHGKRIETFLGARTAGQLAPFHLVNVHSATDDGSKGYHGTVVDLAKRYLAEHPLQHPKIFACGPTPMLKSVATFAAESGIDCELSLEGDMACGIGICQGCPVERVGGSKKYALVCTDGPMFNSKDVILP